MNTGPSLEAQRQAILDRMQMRRENYRRMLTYGTELDPVTDTHIAADQHQQHQQHQHQQHQHQQHQVHEESAYPPAQAYQPVRHAAPSQFPRSMLMRTIIEHPYLCAAGVAAVVLIGPKRIARTMLGAGSTVSALAAGNQSQGDMVGKLLALAGAYVQGRSSDNR